MKKRERKKQEFNLLNANFDDESSEDEDYVPDAKEEKECDKELGVDPIKNKYLDDEPKTGLDILK